MNEQIYKLIHIFEKRFCKSCINKVENEVNLLLYCKNYETERTQFLNKTNDLYPNFKNIPTSEQKYIYLMTNENKIFLEILGKFIFEIFNKRMADYDAS